MSDIITTKLNRIRQDLYKREKDTENMSKLSNQLDKLTADTVNKNTVNKNTVKSSISDTSNEPQFLLFKLRSDINEYLVNTKKKGNLDSRGQHEKVVIKGCIRIIQYVNFILGDTAKLPNKTRRKRTKKNNKKKKKKITKKKKQSRKDN